MKKLMAGLMLVIGFVGVAHATNRTLIVHTAVSVGGTTTQVAAASGRRNFFMVQNDHATQVLYCKFGANGVLNEGIRINAAGGTFIMDTNHVDLRVFNCIATGAATVALVSQGTGG